MAFSREIRLKHGVNLRDLGGYLTSGHHRTRWHCLLRGGYLSSMNRNDLQHLYDYGVRTTIDLRTSAEIAAYPDPDFPGIKKVCLPVLETNLTGGKRVDTHWHRRLAHDPRDGWQMMMRAYRVLILGTHAQIAYRSLLEELSMNRSGAVLFHCASGKDRTGVAAMLVLGALGVPQSTIQTDYLATNRSLSGWVRTRLSQARGQQLGAAYLHSLHDISVAKADYCDQVWALINYEFGGIDNYLIDELQVSPQTIGRLRHLYLQSGNHD